MSPTGGHGSPNGSRDADVAALIPVIRRVVGAKISNATVAEDLVQDALERVLSAAGRVDRQMLEPYAVATARNLMASLWRTQDRQRRHEHRIADHPRDTPVDEALLEGEEHQAVAEALGRLSERERQSLLAHEVEGQDTHALAARLGTSPGAVAAHLHRTRARMRVEYLLALEQSEPPTDRCRPVLAALSLGDRRRQRELDVGRHLLECPFCAELSEPLLERSGADERSARIHIGADADIVVARRRVRELAARLGFSRTDLTVIATAVSEVARNIVRFAGEGDMLLDLLDQPSPGVRVIARDSGPGIADVEQALTDGYSTYHGLGLGLPGARRLMDDFDLVSEVGRGTTVTMVKWRTGGRL